MTFTKVLLHTSVLTIALTFALLANFAYGQWANPPANPPNNNVAAPINTGAGLQFKQGDPADPNDGQIAADKFLSDQYCDSAGANCVTPAALSGGITGIQSGTVTDPGYSDIVVWIPFPTPFATTPTVAVALNEVNYRDGCRNDSVNFNTYVVDVTQFGFSLFMSGGGTCGGRHRVLRTGWIAYN
mgnify:CR=1 FL=1